MVSSRGSRILIGVIGFLIVAAILLLLLFALAPIGASLLEATFNLVFNNGAGIDPALIVQCSDSQGCSIIQPILFSIVVIFIIITGFAYTTLLERKVISWIQQRVGPNRVGPFGLLQPLADGIKLAFKEDIVPAQVDKPVWYMAPMMKAVPILLLVAVIPLGPDILVPWFDGMWYEVPLSLADVNVGVLWVLAVTSLATYGIVLAGWSSSNKYSMLGGLRASAQMISYELSMGLAMAVPIMIVGSMSFGDIVEAQRNIWDWFVFQNPLAAGILVVALFAEVSRSPFDLPEAEQELTQGYMTEYSGMKFALFMMAEYMGMILVAMIAASLFFGGYNLLPVDLMPIAGPLNLLIKVVVFLFIFVWVRGTLPRVRYDRLMQFGWKILLPLALIAVAWTAIALVVGDTFQSSAAYYVVSIIFFLVIVIGGYFILRSSGEEEPEEEDLSTNPLITGDSRNIGWILLQIVGFVIAVPFALFGWLIKQLENLGGFLAGSSDETDIESVDPGSSTPQQSGGD